MLLFDNRQRHVGNAELSGEPHRDALGIGRGSARKADQRSQQDRAPLDVYEMESVQSSLPTGSFRVAPAVRFRPGMLHRIMFDPHRLAQAATGGDRGGAALRHSGWSASHGESPGRSTLNLLGSHLMVGP